MSLFKYFVGIDTSSTSTAVVMTDSSGVVLEHYIITPNSSDIKVRCAIVVKECLELLRRIPRTESIICIEAPAFMATGKVIDLSMLVGGVFYSLLNLDFEVSLVPPSANKKFFTGSGKASKQDMIDTLPEDVKEVFKKYKKKDDLADAYALSRFAKKLATSN